MELEVTPREGQVITQTTPYHFSITELIVEKRDEISAGEEAVRALEGIPNISKSRLGRARGRVKFLRNFVSLLEQGYIPIPRMDFTPLEQTLWHHGKLQSTMYIDKVPVAILATIAANKDNFTTFGLVPRKITRKRDPMIIGILRYGGEEEHFILGWWRPELIKPGDIW